MLDRRASGFALAALLAGPVAASSAQQVHVVDDDGGPGVEFTSLADAVQAAASGDVLLIKSGTYAGFTLDGKGLVLSADAGATVLLQSGAASVKNLSATQTFSVRGLHTFVIAWNLDDDAGTVWFEDCNLEFGDAFGLGTITATDCDNVVVTRCQVTGLPAISTFGDDVPSDGIHALRSQVTVHESVVTGGSGDLSMTTGDVPGQQAVQGLDSSIFLGGSTLTGGPGATSPGGAALLLSGASTVWALDDEFVGGAGTPNGTPVALLGGATLQHLPGPELRLELDSPKRTGESLSLQLEGQPGHQAWLLKWLAPGGFVKPAWSGVLLVDPAHLSLVALGAIPASGQLEFTATVPAIAGLQALPLYLQGVDVAPGSVALTSASHLLLLAPTF